MARNQEFDTTDSGLGTNSTRDKGQRYKKLLYDPLFGPQGGLATSSDDHVLPREGHTLDAATDNTGQNSLVRVPGSAKALTIDGSLGDALFPQASDPNQIFPFYFKSVEILDYNLGTLPIVGDLNFSINEAAMFQATIGSLRESVTPQIGTKHYFGRSEPTRTYQYTERRLDLEFLVYAPSFGGLQHVKERINFLVKSCYPTYEAGAVGGLAGIVADWAKSLVSGGRANLSKDQMLYKEPPIMMLTIGDLFVDVPGIIETLDIDWVGETNRWELEKGIRMPQMAKITMTYFILHKSMPDRTLGADFYPELKVDELNAVYGEGGSMARGQKAQTIRSMYADIDDGITLGKMGKMASNLESIASRNGVSPFDW
jgi:hypothetical protein|tara:strand:- start:2836 stop:3948 length:1113 start_codon:yes stop_codon:yes gene_type:complete